MIYYELTMKVDNANNPANNPVIITKFLQLSAPSLKSTAFVNSPGMRTVY